MFDRSLSAMQWIVPAWASRINPFLNNPTSPLHRLGPLRYPVAGYQHYVIPNAPTDSEEQHNLWLPLQASLEAGDVPYDALLVHTLVQFRPMTTSRRRTFLVNEAGIPLVSDPEYAPHAIRPYPPLIHDPVSAYGMVTPHGVATVSTEHPTSSEQETEDEYPAITLSVNGFPHATMEWHPEYHTWVLRAYTKHEENPVVYIRLDTGEPIPG